MNSTPCFSTRRARRFAGVGFSPAPAFLFLLIGHDRTETVGNNETITIGANRTETVDSNETLTVGGNRNETIRGMDILMVDLCSIETVGLMKMLNVGLGYLINVGAAMNTLVGASSTEEVVLWKNTMVGKSYTMRAGDEIALKADGKASITLGKPGAADAAGNNANSYFSGYNNPAIFGVLPEGYRGMSILGGPWASVELPDGVFNPFDPMGFDPSYRFTPPTPPTGDQITLTVGKASIVLREDGTVTIKGKVSVTDPDTDESTSVPAGTPPDGKGDTKKPEHWWTNDGWYKWLTGKDSAHIANSLLTGVMTTGANLLSGQKVGWSLLGGAISGVTTKDGWLSNELEADNVLPANISNVLLGTTGAAATGATSARGSGASVTTTVIASVSANFKTDGGTLTTPPKTDQPTQKPDGKGTVS